MARRRSLILVAAAGVSPDLAPMGTLAEMIDRLRQFNTAPDGSGAEGWGQDPFMARLHGPGFIVEMPSAAGRDAPVTQAMITVNDEDFAFPVLLRMSRRMQWRLLDPETGRSLG